MSFAWTRNYYAVAECTFPTTFCFESKKSRDSAVEVFGLRKCEAKEAYQHWDCYLNNITDTKYRMLRTKYLFCENLFYEKVKLNDELFVREMLSDTI